MMWQKMLLEDYMPDIKDKGGPYYNAHVNLSTVNSVDYMQLHQGLKQAATGKGKCSFIHIY